ncbi:MAG TPA: hypothetical protein VFT59_02240 [Candidatus Saccharimonadales bacterium]|nr:hypothetical protein [Candidatus Saccharimonadales bacterium]
MFSGLSGSYDQLTQDQRYKLAEFLQLKDEYLQMAVQLNRLRLRALTDPNPQHEAELQSYSSAVMAPVRTRMGQMLSELVKEAVDVDGIKQMLPMALMSFLPSVNLPLLFSILPFDPDTVEKLLGDARSFFRRDM